MLRIKSMLIVLCLLGIMIPGVLAQEPEPEWGYEGDTGPDNWGSLNPEYSLCTEGTLQSPIDIQFADIQPGDFPPMLFDYEAEEADLEDTGHSIQLNLEAGSVLTINDTDYGLMQLHFHAPSEHTIEGEPAAMEVHLVHQSEDGDLLVVSAFIVEGDEPNAVIAPLVEALPLIGEESVPLDDAFDAGLLIDPVEGFLMYEGSLTTPPCTEGVIWLIWSGTIQLSAEQIAAFTALYEGNVRPVQPLNDRAIWLRGS